MTPRRFADIEPGQHVRHPAQPDWGIGQVQSAIGPRVTVNFAHAGKILVNAEVVSLEIVPDGDVTEQAGSAGTRP